jgi:hypothetical protein
MHGKMSDAGYSAQGKTQRKEAGDHCPQTTRMTQNRGSKVYRIGREEAQKTQKRATTSGF